MNKSLRFKLSLMLMVIVLIIILSCVLISSFFLGDYYIYGKQRALAEAYQEIDRLYQINNQSFTFDVDGEQNTTEESAAAAEIKLTSEFQISMERMSEGKNVSILILQDSYSYNLLGTIHRYRPIYSSVSTRTSSFNSEVNSMLLDFTDSQDSASTLVEKQNYLIQKIFVTRLGNSYMYLSARLNNGDYLLLRTSLESIEDNVSISNRFFIYIASLILVCGTLIVYFISRKFTQPILLLANIASRMAEMDFNTKYQVEGEDEIAVLGSSINYLSETLESSLAELKEANTKLRRDLDQKTKIENMRTEFLSNVSHELKTPIALIQGYAEGLNENINDDEESRAFYCEVIMDEASKMNDIVKKLLNLNQLEFGNNNIHMEHFDVTAVVANMLASSEILFKQKQVTLEFDAQEEIYAWSDVYMTEEIFSNYLSNALNHIEGENIICVSIEKLDTTVRVSVFNTGQPVPEEDLPKIWDKFYKVDKARTREYGGSGVGLSIVKATMELLGQHYGVENRADGVEFWFELDAKNL